MSNIQIVSGRAALASAALLSLAVLAGCESGAGEAKPPAVASADPAATALMPTAPSEADLAARLINVGDRVRFELDRYDLSPEAQAT